MQGSLAQTRLVPLEACRGLAALVVLLHHAVLGFAPTFSGYMPAMRNDDSLVGAPYFALLNGGAAVGFFFTLSGFVLCWSYFQRPEADRLMLALVKRLPRLVGLVLLTTLLSWALFYLSAYRHVAAAPLTGSEWLASFAGASWPEGFQPGFWSALSEGLTTFLTGQTFYNTNLWTMRPEFLGSLLVYLLGGFIVSVLQGRYLALFATLLAVAALFRSPLLFPFVVGVFLAARLVRAPLVVPTWQGALLILCGLYLLGYVEPIGAYSWLSSLPSTLLQSAPVLMFTAGSALLIVGVMGAEAIRNRLQGRLSVWLGRLSFPLYLVHTLVICSASSALYLTLHSVMPTGAAAALAMLSALLISVVVSVPLVWFDAWWVGRVDRAVRRALDATPRVA